MSHERPVLLTVTDYAEHYETAETRKLAQLRWVPVPNGIKRGYSRLMDAHGFKGLGVWLSILQTASRTHRKDRNGTIYGPIEDFILEVRGDLLELQEVLPTLQQIGWIRLVVARTAGSPGTPAKPPAVWKEGMEGRKGREGEEEKVEESSSSNLLRPIHQEVTGSLTWCKPDEAVEFDRKAEALIARVGLDVAQTKLRKWAEVQHAMGWTTHAGEFFAQEAVPEPVAAPAPSLAQPSTAACEICGGGPTKYDVPARADLCGSPECHGKAISVQSDGAVQEIAPTRREACGTCHGLGRVKPDPYEPSIACPACAEVSA